MGAMHVEPGIAERRIRNLLDQRIRPAIYGPGSPLSVTAHHVEGEPIGVAEAERADYLPFAVRDPGGPPWGTSRFRFSATVPKHLAGRRVEKTDWLLFALAGLFIARFVYMATA